MKSFVRPLYNHFIRPYTPKKIAVFNGIAVRGVRLFDSTDVFPTYERPLINAIRSRIDNGDTVVVVGGGRGVSSVVAAYRAGQTGQVVAFEGSMDRVEQARETIRLNAVDETASIRHAVVGTAVELANDPDGASSVEPADLPDCSVLVLDCEGAEIEILRKLDDRPRAIIVETHAFLGASEDRVRDLLSDRGYDIVDRGVEHEEKGVFVLTAVDRSSAATA